MKPFLKQLLEWDMFAGNGYNYLDWFVKEPPCDIEASYVLETEVFRLNKVKGNSPNC